MDKINFSLSIEAARYLGALIAERPIKEAGVLAVDWDNQFKAELQRLQAEQREQIRAEVKAEVEKLKNPESDGA